jgi:predicted metal-binding membrane protein
VLSGVLLLAAGAYQLTPMQYNLLKRCRQPLHFMRLNWQEGTGGAFVMGLKHGAYCLVCCFVLMGVLFFGGVTNLLLLAAVTAFVLFEKALPNGNIAGRVSGPLMIAAGVYVLAVQP